MSRDNRATKKIICITKSKEMARPAYKAIALTLGIPDSAPEKIQKKHKKKRKQINIKQTIDGISQANNAAIINFSIFMLKFNRLVIGWIKN